MRVNQLLLRIAARVRMLLSVKGYSLDGKR